MAEIRWIKLRIDMFDDEKIKIIQSMPDGDAILVIWIRLIALAGKCNANGLVLVEDEFPYSDEMLSVIFGKPLATVRLALNTFEKFRMIENTQKGIYITNFEKHQNVEGMERIREQNRIRQQRARQRKKDLLLEGGESVPCLPDSGGEENISADNVTNASRDKSREITEQRENKEIEKDIYNISSYEDIIETPEGEPEKETGRLDYQRIMSDFHRICIDLPKIRAMSDERKKKVRTLLNGLEKLKIWPEVTKYEQLQKLFQMAQESDFLSGRSGKWDNCSFDWLMNKTNALKVIEGNYANKGGAGDGRNARSEPRNGERVGNPSGTLDNTTAGALERFRRNSGV